MADKQTQKERGKNEDMMIEAKGFFESYKKEIGQSLKKGKGAIFLDFMRITEYNSKLAEELLVNPEEALRLVEVALEELGLVESARVRLFNLPGSQEIKVGDIRSRNLNEMIVVEGLVRQSSDVRPQVVNAKFECPSCGSTISVMQMEKKFREPSRCSCGRRGGFKLISKEMVDTQRLVVEEAPESLTGGEQPKRINVFLKEDLVEPNMEEKTTPGSRVKVIGILKEVPVPMRSGGLSTRFELALEANNVIPLEETFEDLDINEEDERQILELSQDPKLFEKLKKSMIPSVWGYDEIKRSLVLQLFGGVKKTHADGQISRGDFHILLIGDPGVAKSIGPREKILYHKKNEFRYEEIQEIFNKFGQQPKNLNVLTINMESHKPAWKAVKEIVKHAPEKELIKVTTAHGKMITATKDHSFITLDKGKIVPIKGEKLKKENYLPIPINFHKEILRELDIGNLKTYKTNSKEIPNKIKLNEKSGFFFGIFLSEGYIDSGKSIKISNKNKKIQTKIKDFVNDIGINARQNDKEVIINSKSLANVLETFCYNKNEKEKNKKKGNISRIKKIPDFCFFATREFIKGVISGLFSGDGRFVKDKKRIKGFELVTVSQRLAHGTSDLLFSIGILNKINKSQYTYKKIKTEYYKVLIPSQSIKKFRKNFNFYGRAFLKYPPPVYSYNNLIPCGDLVYEVTKKLGYNSRKEGDRSFAAQMRTVKKRGVIGRLRLRKIIKKFEHRKKEEISEIDTLKKLAYSPIIWSKVISIEKRGREKNVYDLNVPETKTFVSNGIGVHNSATLGFMARIAPKGRYVVGKSTTGAGLTATVIRDEYLRGWSLEAGSMVLANKGLVCIDELEKMDPQDRSAMHEAMEQQCMLPDFKLLLSNGKDVPIGKFVDNLIEKNKSSVYQGKNCEILPVKNVELISTDFKKHFPIKADRVSRHKAPKEFIKITLANGREITVTPEHPCWIVKNGEITIVPAEKLKEGEFFPVPSKIDINEKRYEKKNDVLCKILGYHISDGCYELNKGKKNCIQFWNNDKKLIDDYRQAVEKYFNVKTGLTQRKHQYAVRVISKKVIEKIKKIDKNLLEKGDIKKIPGKIMQLPKENIKYLLRALFDGNGTIVFQKRGGCRVTLTTENKDLAKQVSDLLLRFGIQSSIFKDKNFKKVDISGQENLNAFLREISFLSQKKKNRLKEYCEKEKTYRSIRDIIPECTNKINTIFKKLEISAKKEIGHSIDLGVEKHRVFLQKLVLIAKKEISKIKNPDKNLLKDLEEIEKLAFGYSNWVKIKKVEKIKNKGIPWVYDVTIEPFHTFISNGMILHNTVTISKANVHATLRSQTSVLAAANPKFGRFDPYQSIAQQIDLPPTLINRFDVIFPLRDLPDKDKDEKIAQHVLSEHREAGQEMYIPKELLRKYVAYAKQKIRPKLSDEAVKKIKKFYVELRNMPVSSESSMKPIPISARQLQALIRMSEASAKMRLSEEVAEEDADRAIEIMKYYLMQVGYDYESKTFDIDRGTGGMPASQRNKVFLVRDTIAQLEDKLGKMIPIEEIENELEGKMTKTEIEEAITKLDISGVIFRPRRGYVGRT